MARKNLKMKVKTAVAVGFLFCFMLVQVKFISTLRLLSSNIATDKIVHKSWEKYSNPSQKSLNNIQSDSLRSSNQKLLYNDQIPVVITKIKPQSPLSYSKISDALPDNYIEQQTFIYSPFSIPPPFNLPPYILHSSGYQESLSNKVNCDEHICRTPHSYLIQYNQSPCFNNKINCSDETYFQVYYESKYTKGEVDVIKNGLLPPNFICDNSNSNNNNNNANNYLKEKPYSIKSKRYDGTVVYLLVENSNSLEGFVLNILPKVVQIESYLQDKNIKFYIDLAPQNFILKQLLRRLGISSRRIIRALPNNENIRITADILILPCNSPKYNPLSLQRGQYLMNIPFLTNNNGIGSENQNTIIYLSRNRGDYNNDNSKQVINERDVIITLRRIAKSNSLRLIIYDNTKYNNVDRVISIWDKVLIMVGPSGDAFYNMVFARRNVAVVELFPGSDSYSSNEDNFRIFKTASLLGLSYYSLPCRTEGSNYNLEVDTGRMERLISLLVRS